MADGPRFASELWRLSGVNCIQLFNGEHSLQDRNDVDFWTVVSVQENQKQALKQSGRRFLLNLV